LQQFRDDGIMQGMKTLRNSALAALAMLLIHAPMAHSAGAPPFDVAYRAWDAVTELARQNNDPRISGECGKTFRPFVVPGLRGQTLQERDVAAAACVDAASAACMNGQLRTSQKTARKCEEFRSR